MCEPREFFQDGYMSNTRTFEAKKGEFIAIHVRRKPNGKLRVTIDYGPDKGLLACEDFLDIFDIPHEPNSYIVMRSILVTREIRS